jgi:oligopeptide/dipeptide ABC transporter ATP-binding protein
MGTDQPYGRDIFSRLVNGGRYDLLIGFAATGVTLVCGTIVGLISGYVGGLLDTVFMRIVDVFFAFPFFVLVLAIVSMRGPGLLSLLIAIWFIGWVAYARIVRGEVLVAKEQEYVMAARALGYNPLRIMARHVLPNVIAAALIFSMADAVANILLGASRGYFGLGVPEPTPEWGSMSGGYVSALDVSVQAQVLNLMMRLQEDLGLTYFFVAHNLGMVQHISQRVAVMYLGKIVELAPTSDLFVEPLHPYTQALLRAVPKPVARRKGTAPAIQGDPPNPIHPPTGCYFHPRYPFAMPICWEQYPALRSVIPGHTVACHLYPE